MIKLNTISARAAAANHDDSDHAIPRARILQYFDGQRSHSRTLHTLAVLTACATFLLIFMGGLVTSHQAGMSVPDWPNSYGYNMFLFPPRLWIGGILYEHTHRLMGSIVGVLSIAMVLTAFLAKSTTWTQRLLCVLVLGAVILQGVLGGLRVVLVKLDLAIVHACIAQAFFCLVVYLAMVTSRGWLDTDTSPLGMRSDPLRKRGLVLLGVASVGLIYLQLLIGAIMRHYQAGLAIPDLPLVYGHWLPPITQAQLDTANSMRIRQLNLDPVTLGQVWLHFGHRLGAIVVSVAIVALSIAVIGRYRQHLRLLRLVGLLLALLAVQVTLGVLTVLYRKPADVASAHVAVGALVLVTGFVFAVRAAQLNRPVEAPAPADRNDRPVDAALAPA